MFRLLCVVLMAAVTSVLAISLNTAESPVNPESHDSETQELKLIATVDGKAYYADRTRGGWFSTSYYCEANGMKLASITTQNQFTVLNNSYSASDFSGWYWTSGRDARSIRQFVWNETEEELYSSFLPFRLVPLSPGINDCVGLNVGVNESFLSSIRCSDSSV